jgi:PBP1b-binding outer membrane lipoprotein LpoB
MKLLSLFIMSAFVLSSCSNNENLFLEVEKTNSLKSYKVKRNASGAYSIEYDLEKNRTSQKAINSETNAKEFYLYQSNFAENKTESEELFIDVNKLSISFLDGITHSESNIIIEDDPISLAKTNTHTTKMLSEYTVSKNEDGTFHLDFKVRDEVSVDFVHNKELDIYEIHLEEGNSNGNGFSRNFEKSDGDTLRIDFVNHTKEIGAKGSGYSGSYERKPRIIIVHNVAGI